MKKIALVVIIAMTSWACVTLSLNYKLGTEAEMNKKWEEAIQFYERASLENPKEPVYRLALIRARIGASLFHLQEARKLVAQGRKEEAKAEYAKALSYNLRDTSIAREARVLTAETPKEPAPKKEKLEFPIKLKAKEDRLQLKFPAETGLKSILLALGKSAGINMLFDENFREMAFTTELADLSFEEALKSVCYATKNFYRIIDERTVIIVPDLPQKRMQYEVNAIRTFYLSNLKADAAQGYLMSMLIQRAQGKVPMLVFDKDLNSVTIRDTPQVLELAEKLIAIWDKPKGEVLIDLEIMEVSRLKLRQLGVSFDQNVVGARYGEAPTDSTQTTSWFNLKGLDFSKADNFSVSLPLAYLQFLESDTETKIVAQPRLPGVSDEEINYKVGQKIPIPKTSFSPLIAGGLNQQPITQIDQWDVGIEVKIKPKVHLEKEVTLEMDIKVTSLGGKGYADIPIIQNREIKNVMRFKDGETKLIAGLLRDEERKTLKGIPGLKDIPVLGRLFGAEDTILEQTDVILTITPYIVRSIPLNPEDLKALWVDVESVTSGSGGLGGFEEALLDREINPGEAMRAIQRLQQNVPANAIILMPKNYEVSPNRPFNIAVSVRSDQEIGNLSLALNYDARLVTLREIREGGMTRQLGANVPFLKNIDNNSGVCTLGFSSPQPGKGMKGGGTLATLIFEGKSPGECMIGVTNISAMSPSGQVISFQVDQSRIIVR
jgi:general secretion pathway protein D